MAATIENTVTEVNFTYAINGGMWIKTQDQPDSARWFSFRHLEMLLGKVEVARLLNIACRLTGSWHKV